jgi:hypothetical protein
VGGGPTGNYLRLVSAVNASRNSIGFDLTDKGAFCDVTIDFDFRLTPGTGSADGFSVTLIDTANYDESGAVSVAEEPNLFGSVGIGFDIYENPGDLNDNHVSVHFDGASLVEVDATPVLDLDGTAGNFVHAQILISSDDTGGSVTVTLTPPGGSPTTLVNALAVPALRPYEGRINFGARTGGANADHDLDNLVATYTGCPSVLGSWGAVQPWPVVPIHTHMLPTGQVLFWDRDDALPATHFLWDPASELVSPAADPGLDLFCSGHSFLSNGHLFASGGHDLVDGIGLPYGHIYDPFANTWTQVSAQMNLGRWYPTNVPLANGDVLVVSGSYSPGQINNLPQVYEADTGTWRDLSSAVLGVALYPLMHLGPDGIVIMTGPSATTLQLDTSGTGSWSTLGTTGAPSRSYGTSVLYDDGQILLVGGSDPPLASAEVLDLYAPSPTWRFVDSMAYSRRQLNTTILADGSLLVTGGTQDMGFNNATGSIYAAELWDPSTETWRTLSGAETPRIYHSFALLLPDARVLTGGGGHPPGGSGDLNHLNVEVYSPPYLFQGPRPVIDVAPEQVSYGAPFPILTLDASAIADVHMIRLSSVTHSTNINQSISRLSFSQGTDKLIATAPSNPNSAPPGHYMLFILDGNGVPSVSKIVQLSSTPVEVPVLPIWGVGSPVAFMVVAQGLVARRRKG